MARKKSATKRAKEEAAREGIPEQQKAAPVAEPEREDESSNDVSGSEDSEEEDEYGQLLTSNVEQSIQKVMEALKTDPKKLLDPEAKFFDESAAVPERKAAEKPMYLKDYHRMNLLSGDYKNDDDAGEYRTVDGEKPYVVTEREERSKLLEDIKGAFGDEEDDDDDGDDGFLKKKTAPARIEEVSMRLPDPSVDADAFLQSFVSTESWIPKKNDKVINLDQIDNEDEQEFDDAVEDLERAYNFRYEDPSAAEIVSYARNQASLRRGKTNARKSAREKKHAVKEQEKHEIEQALQKKKTAKVNKVADRLQKIKEAVGDDVSDAVIEKVFGDSLLKDDFDDADWDGRMAEIFNEQYYGGDSGKPKWDEDDEIMGEFYQKGDDDDDDAAAEEVEEEEEAAVEAAKPSKKDKIKEKNSAKKEKRTLKEKAQQLVEANTVQIRDEVEEERGRSKEDVQFRYREVSPESFGLSTREILLADDQDLNKFISIKKFAPYKPKEAALKEKRRFTKKKRLQQWRREIFHDKNGPARQEQEKENEVWIPVEEEPPLKKTKKDKKHKSRK